MLTNIMETTRGEPLTNAQMYPSSQTSSSAPAVKTKKTPLTSRSNDLQSTYLQQFKWYLLPLIPLKPLMPWCLLPWPLQLNYNPVPSLEEWICQEAEEAHLEVEEAHPEVEEACQEEAMHRQLPNQKENPWERCQQYSKEITPKLRVSSGNSPPTF